MCADGGKKSVEAPKLQKIQGIQHNNNRVVKKVWK